MLNQLQFPGMPESTGGSSAPVEEQHQPSPQQQKLERNRQRITGEGNPRTASGSSDVVPVHRFGLQTADWDQYDFDTHADVFHDTYNFRRHGETKFVNLVGDDAVKMVQEVVTPERVKQIAQDPSTGSDPRFPGTELPKVLQRTSGALEAVNGTHRIAAAVGYQGRLFTEARVLPEEKIEEVPNLLQQARSIREEVGYKRYRTGNPRSNL